MKAPAASWRAHSRLVLDLFVVFNLAFLALEIYLAHDINDFRDSLEWIPFYFSLIAPVLLVLSLAGRRIRVRWARRLGWIVAVAGIVIGLAGVILHLQSQFFVRPSFDALVYTAPFAAPLAYVGLGTLLLINRLVPSHEPAWGRSIVLAGSAGFLATLAMAFFDHAQNEFYYATQWIPVFSSALAVGFLAIAGLAKPQRRFLDVCFAVVAIQVVVALGGFYYHLAANLDGPSSSVYDNFVHGAPVFVPMLLADLALLSAIGLWDLRTKTADLTAGDL